MVGGMTERPSPWRTTTPGRIVDDPPESIGPGLNSLGWVCPLPGRVVQLIPAPFPLCLACLLRKLWQWWRRRTASLVSVPWFLTRRCCCCRLFRYSDPCCLPLPLFCGVTASKDFNKKRRYLCIVMNQSQFIHLRHIKRNSYYILK